MPSHRRRRHRCCVFLRVTCRACTCALSVAYIMQIPLPAFAATLSQSDEPSRPFRCGGGRLRRQSRLRAHFRTCTTPPFWVDSQSSSLSSSGRHESSLSSCLSSSQSALLSLRLVTPPNVPQVVILSPCSESSSCHCRRLRRPRRLDLASLHFMPLSCRRLGPRRTRC